MYKSSVISTTPYGARAFSTTTTKRDARALLAPCFPSSCLRFVFLFLSFSLERPDRACAWFVSFAIYIYVIYIVRYDILCWENYDGNSIVRNFLENTHTRRVKSDSCFFLFIFILFEVDILTEWSVRKIEKRNDEHHGCICGTWTNDFLVLDIFVATSRLLFRFYTHYCVSRRSNSVAGSLDRFAWNSSPSLYNIFNSCAHDETNVAFFTWQIALGKEKFS